MRNKDNSITTSNSESINTNNNNIEDKNQGKKDEVTSTIK